MEQKPTISFDDFLKADIRVGLVENVELHPNADKLLVLTVNFGELGTRTICAGIREFTKEPYEWGSLKGSRFAFVINLQPRVMRGVESQGMILAAANEAHDCLSLLEIRTVMTKARDVASDPALIPAGAIVG